MRVNRQIVQTLTFEIGKIFVHKKNSLHIICILAINIFKYVYTYKYNTYIGVYIWGNFKL